MLARWTTMFIMLGAATGFSPVLAQNVSDQSITVDGLERSYVLVLPDDLQPGERLPVMIWTHGGGGNARCNGYEAVLSSVGGTADFNPRIWSLSFDRAWPKSTRILDPPATRIRPVPVLGVLLAAGIVPL